MWGTQPRSNGPRLPAGLLETHGQAPSTEPSLHGPELCFCVTGPAFSPTDLALARMYKLSAGSR